MEPRRRGAPPRPPTPEPIMSVAGCPGLSPEQIVRFHRDGAITGVVAVSPDVASRNLRLFDAREARDGGPQPHYLQLHSEEQWAWELVTAPSIVRSAVQLLGTEDVFCLATCVARGPQMCDAICVHTGCWLQPAQACLCEGRGIGRLRGLAPGCE
eukprot:SAG31_NODE_4067_length_3622_cov_17.161510_1_plen_155_part_00